MHTRRQVHKQAGAKDERHTAIAFNKCWICKEALKGGVNHPFMTGPMCIVKSVCYDPPAHVECARRAAEAAGRLTALAFTRTYEITQDNMRMTLFHFEKPIAIEWYQNGRRATRLEVMSGIEAGLAELRPFMELQPEHAQAAFERDVNRAMKFIPRV